MPEIRVNGVYMGELAADWSLELSKIAAAGTSVTRKRNGKVERMTLADALTTFELETTSSRESAKRPTE